MPAPHPAADPLTWAGLAGELAAWAPAAARADPAGSLERWCRSRFRRVRRVFALCPTPAQASAVDAAWATWFALTANPAARAAAAEAVRAALAEGVRRGHGS